jgi:TIR domain-containing protein/pentapeptide repeat protein
MANPKHLVKLQEGIEVWNEWRNQNPVIVPDLTGANLKRTSLGRVNFRDADLSEANLFEASLVEANLDFAELKSAVLVEADLSAASLTETHMARTDLRGADLARSIFSGTHLRNADFTNARLWQTVFLSIDLSEIHGLKAVEHDAPSIIDIETIYRSQGKIPEVFQRGAGVPENFITFMHSLTAEPFDYYSCFISYSNKDKEFAESLHSYLQAKGVRCWYAPEDLKTGDRFRQRIDEAIRIYDKLLVVLSENSIQSSWVEEEVEGAFEKERRENRLALFPIRLDDVVMKTEQAWASSLRRTRHIADFTKWKDHDSYQDAFKRLLRDLQGKERAAASDRP